MIKYGELPIREYLTEYIPTISNELCKKYHNGITTMDIFTLELYYFEKCYEFNDKLNFVSNNSNSFYKN